MKHRHPDEADFHRAYRSLSKAIDLVRGVYQNIGESHRSIGLYPYEPLHDIRKVMERIGCKEVDEATKLKCIAEIEEAWNALRYHFLLEFERPQATHPITTRSKRDPRKRPD